MAHFAALELQCVGKGLLVGAYKGGQLLSNEEEELDHQLFLQDSKGTEGDDAGMHLLVLTLMNCSPSSESMLSVYCPCAAMCA